MKKIILALSLLFSPAYAFAQESFSIYMDAEFNDWLENMATPLLEAAEISPSTVNIYIAKSNELNAFATPNNEIVLFSGLILRAESEDEVRGVLAHEIGHLKAQHYLKARVKQERDTIPSILGAILGVGAAAAGSPQAAQALILGGMSTTQSNVLHHSRTHEWEADKIGLALLEKSHANPNGFIRFFEELRQEQLFYSKTPPAYLLTHPLSSDRMQAAQATVDAMENVGAPASNVRFNRIQTKLAALGREPKATQRILALEIGDNAHYGLAIAYALEGKTNDAIEELKKIPNWENDAFYNDIMAQLYLDLSDLEQAQVHLEQAINLKPKNKLLRFNVAVNLIHLEREEDAIGYLRKLLLEAPKWPAVYHQLGIAYGKLGKMPESHLFLAEEALLNNDNTLARQHLSIAKAASETEFTEALEKKYQHLKNTLTGEKE